ncbi:MAG: hypothetical protein K2X03_30020 [Bryobacteraceae bacterium]|nr:hypothetical protein [Bryobacteraceae bacterium]
MAKPAAQSDFDWTACEFPVRCPGGPFCGVRTSCLTPLWPDAIVDSYDLGETVEELREGFPSLSVDQVKWLIELAHTQPPSRNLNLAHAVSLC